MEIDSGDTGVFLEGPLNAMEMDNLPNGLQSGSEQLDGPPDGFDFIVPFLDLQSRLTVERVSKSLRGALRDPLAWQHLQIERPATRNLTDSILHSLVRRAEGRLKSLSISQSLRITETGLVDALDLNPGLEKLAIPGCTGISAEAVVQLVEAHSLKARARGLPGIKEVQVRGLYNITEDHLNRLQRVLEPGGGEHDGSSKVLAPLFYGSGAGDARQLDGRPIDVGVCPSCSNVRVIYDCTTHVTLNDREPSCQGCAFCIRRCEECGCCIPDIGYDESLCADLVCASCWFDLPKCVECNRAVCGRHAHELMAGNGDSFTCVMCLGRQEFLFG